MNPLHPVPDQAHGAAEPDRIGAQRNGRSALGRHLLGRKFEIPLRNRASK